MLVVKDVMLLLVTCQMIVVTLLRGPANRPGASSHVIPDPGHPTQRRWKRLRPPSSEGEGVRWACLAIFFLALDLPSEGTGAGAFFPAGQSSRRCQRTGAAHLKLVARS